MAECEACGNDYDKAFEVVMDGRSHVYDCFECAVHELAPVCQQCGVKIVGHGRETGGLFFCCDHCARKYGAGAG